MVYIFDNYLLQTWGILNFCYLFISQKQKKADCFSETLGINVPDEFTIFPDTELQVRFNACLTGLNLS